MPEDNNQPVPDQNIPNQNPTEEVKSPVALDNSLEDALSKHFATKEPEVNKEEVVDEKKKEDLSKVEEKSTPEKTESTSSKQASSSKLPDPDSIGETPSGRKVSQESKLGWDTLRSNYKTAHRLAEEREKEIVALKQSIADRSNSSTKEVDELKKQVDELSKYRAMVDVQADPEFISKYDEPISQRKSDIKDLLTPHGVNEATLNAMDFTDSKAISEVASIIRKERGDVDADDFLASARDLRSLLTKRDKAAKETGEKYKEHIENKKKESFSKAAEDEGKTMRHLEKTVKEKAISFLNKREVRDGAGKAELDQVAEHNKLVDLMNSKVSEVLKMNTPEDKAEVAIAAVASHWLNAQNKQLQQRVASLEGELKKISAVNSETEKPRGNVTKGNGNNLDLDSAMSTFFNGR